MLKNNVLHQFIKFMVFGYNIEVGTGKPNVHEIIGANGLCKQTKRGVQNTTGCPAQVIEQGSNRLVAKSVYCTLSQGNNFTAD